MLKQLGLFSIVCMWIGTYILLRHHSPELGKSISKHASRNTQYHVLYGLLELTVVGLFSLFIFGWFIPAFKLGIGYTSTATIGIVGTVVAALIPDRDGWRSIVHAIGAYSMAVTLMLMSLLLFASPHINLAVKLFLCISLLYMVAGWIVAVFNVQFFKKNMLKLQVLYFLAFHIPIILAVYS